MRIKIVGALLIVTTACGVGAVTAGAVITTTPDGARIGYLPLNGETPSGHGGVAPIHATVPNEEGQPPLIYHGGPVMHSHTAYAIFWAPSGYSFPAGYTAAIETYLKDVAADSHKSTNVYSVSAQYTDGTGRAAYSDSFGGSVADTHAYPTTGTCPLYSGAESFTACISDEKLEKEVESVVAEQGWPSDLNSGYYVVLPPHAGSCFDKAGTVCFDKQFCAYHSYTIGTEAIYANISYSPGDPVGCGVGQYPNGTSNGKVDDTLSSLSHEANESITDPTLEAWYDVEGLENGDECRNTPFEEDYGAPLGGSAGTLFNQAIGDGHYYMQQEWSNDVEDCEQRIKAPVLQISGPGQLAPGQSGAFSAAGSIPGEDELVSFEWEFSDGGSASGLSVSHAFAVAGTYSITLTAEDEFGYLYSMTRQANVAVPGPEGGEASPISSNQTSSSPGTTVIQGNGPKALKCRKGFRKGRKHGKPACVKIKAHRHHHHR